MRNRVRVCGLLPFLFLVVAVQSASAQTGVLFAGTDTFDFNNAPSQLAKTDITGVTAGTPTILSPTFYVNGLAEGPGFLYAGEARSNILRTIDYNGGLLTSVTSGTPNGYFNEDMTFDGTNLWRAYFPGVAAGEIVKVNPVTGAALATYAQDDTVGITLVGSTFWITHWSAKQVGTWDPITNTFTPVFSTLNNAGGLAYDPSTGTLWVGELGGSVVPYTLAGVAKNAGFCPFGCGANVDTIDGLAFVPTPEPFSLLLLSTGLVGVAFKKRKVCRVS